MYENLCGSPVAAGNVVVGGERRVDFQGWTSRRAYARPSRRGNRTTTLCAAGYGFTEGEARCIAVLAGPAAAGMIGSCGALVAAVDGIPVTRTSQGHHRRRRCRRPRGRNRSRGAALDVEVPERAAAPGGNNARVARRWCRCRRGPTVFTMRWILDVARQRRPG